MTGGAPSDLQDSDVDWRLAQRLAVDQRLFLCVRGGLGTQADAAFERDGSVRRGRAAAVMRVGVDRGRRADQRHAPPGVALAQAAPGWTRRTRTPDWPPA
jgi:hypothetical protein